LPDDLGVFLLHGGLAFSGLLKKPTIGKSTGCFGQVGTPVLAMEDGIVPWIQPVMLKRHAACTQKRIVLESFSKFRASAKRPSISWQFTMPSTASQ
jgi:hypothetical protein